MTSYLKCWIYRNLWVGTRDENNSDTLNTAYFYNHKRIKCANGLKNTLAENKIIAIPKNKIDWKIETWKIAYDFDLIKFFLSLKLSRRAQRSTEKVNRIFALITEYNSKGM